jgi:excinuclease UvrABC nuclease subunit
MAIGGSKYPYTDENINKSPLEPGVYALYDGNITIYIGRASGTNTIRKRLQDHISGNEGTCTQNATHYRREVNYDPIAREKQLLEEYKYDYNKLPRCNNVMP